MNIEKHLLFPTLVAKTKIDPLSFNKQKIIDEIILNYKKNPLRNKWDKNSNLHHYYEDWENPEYDAINLQELYPIYNEAIKSYLKSWNFIKGKKIKYTHNITNITVYDEKNKSQKMNVHDHMSDITLFTVVHYIKVKSTNYKLKFYNPLLFAQFQQMFKLYGDLIDDDYSPEKTEHSVYYDSFIPNIEEDDAFFIPAYLKHSVEYLDDFENIEKNDYRICVVVNVNRVL